MKIDGKQIAQEILNDLKIQIAKSKIKPHLAIIIVGDDPASISYVKQKMLKAEEIGAKTTLITFDYETTEEELLTTIEKLNNDETITGIIVQKPLPKQIDNATVNYKININKDIDSFNPVSKFDPPIGLAILEIFKKINGNLNNFKNKKVVILGKGKTGGEPIKKTLLKLDIDPITVDSKTENPEQIIKAADVIISAVGKKEIIASKMIKQGAILIGAGQHLEKSGQFRGDYRDEEIENIASFYTPTPGGIGPINVAMLLKNLVEA